MNISDLKPAQGSTKRRKRVGRGHGCHVKTAGRGSKGQNSRSGGGKGPAFEGGQSPWYRRLPKFKGFKNNDKVIFSIVSLGRLNGLDAGTVVTPELLRDMKLIRKLDKPIKVLAAGKLEKALTVRLHAFSEAAKAGIEAAGGKAEVI
jgi:large subunit ribosomal protein L15